MNSSAIPSSPGRAGVTEATVEEDELRVLDCRSASERFGVPEDRALVLGSLTPFLVSVLGSSAVSLNFPFGFRTNSSSHDWVTFLARIPGRFTSSEDLHR